MVIKTIEIEEAKEKINQGKHLIVDVRTPTEYEDHHINGSVNIPLDSLLKYKKEILKSEKKPIFVCKTGNRSGKACEILKKELDNDFFSLKGGLDEWEKNNLEINYGRKTWNLERQVRFTAGSIVCLGILLSFYVNDNFKFISLFIGMGLVFSAITNTCGLGMLISKMPWNKTQSEEEMKKRIQKSLLN